MDMNDLESTMASRIALTADVSPMDNMIKAAAESLYGSFVDNPKAIEELQKEVDAMYWSCSSNGPDVVFNLEEPEETTFVDTVSEDQGVPVSGGDNGIAHNPDGTTYQSQAKVFGIELPWFVLPVVDFKEEIKKRSNALARDCASSAINENKSVIYEPLEREIKNVLGGLS